MPKYSIEYELVYRVETTVEAACEGEAQDLIAEDARPFFAERDIGCDYRLEMEFVEGTVRASELDEEE